MNTDHLRSAIGRRARVFKKKIVYQLIDLPFYEARNFAPLAILSKFRKSQITNGPDSCLFPATPLFSPLGSAF